MSKSKRSAGNAAARRQAMAAASGIVRKRPKVPEPPIEKGRRGRRGVVVYLHPLAKEALSKIAHEHRKTIQDLGVEAINLLFSSYGEKPIA